MFLSKKKKKGLTLIETTLAMGIFAILVTMAITILMASVHQTAADEQAASYQDGVDNFVYGLIIEMKSAQTIDISGDDQFPVLEIKNESGTIRYEVNNLRGEIVKVYANGSRKVIIDDFAACYFNREDLTSFTLVFYLTDKDKVQYIMRCGSPLAAEDAAEIV